MNWQNIELVQPPDLCLLSNTKLTGIVLKQVYEGLEKIHLSSTVENF